MKSRQILEVFDTVLQAKVPCEQWRRHHDAVRPHKLTAVQAVGTGSDPAMAAELHRTTPRDHGITNTNRGTVRGGRSGPFAQTRADLLSGKAICMVDEYRRPSDPARYLATASFVGQNRDFMRPDLVETMTRLRSTGGIHVYDRHQVHLTFVPIRRLEDSEGMISSEELAELKNALIDTLAESDGHIVLTRAAIGPSLASVLVRLADPHGTMARLRLSLQRRLKRLGYPPFPGFDVSRMHVNLARFTPLADFKTLTSSLKKTEVPLGGDFELDSVFLEIADAVQSPQSILIGRAPLPGPSS